MQLHRAPLHIHRARLHGTLRRGGRGVLGAMVCGLLCIGQASGRPVYALAGAAVSGSTALGALQAEMNGYAFSGSLQEQQQLHAQLEVRLSRRGFYRLWNRPLEMETNQLAEGWYDAETDQTVVCVSWATPGGRAQQVQAMSGKGRGQDLLPAS